jgi:hypothetical protein
MSEPAFVGRSHIYWVAPLHGVRHLPFRYETFGPIRKERNPQAVKAEQWIADFYLESSLSALKWSESEKQQIVQIAKGEINGEQCRFE